MGFPAGHYLDPQPLASGNVFQRQAYGNYAFVVYMASAGVSLNNALSGANTYAFFRSSYPKSTPMDPTYGSLPAASVTNIRNGYNGRVARPLVSLTAPIKRVPRSSRSLRRAGVENAGASLLLQVAS